MLIVSEGYDVVQYFSLQPGQNGTRGSSEYFLYSCSYFAVLTSAALLSTTMVGNSGFPTLRTRSCFWPIQVSIYPSMVRLKLSPSIASHRTVQGGYWSWGIANEVEPKWPWEPGFLGNILSILPVKQVLTNSRTPCWPLECLVHSEWVSVL